MVRVAGYKRQGDKHKVTCVGDSTLVEGRRVGYWLSTDLSILISYPNIV